MHRLHGTLSETVLYSIPMSLSLRRDTVNENVTALAKINTQVYVFMSISEKCCVELLQE